MLGVSAPNAVVEAFRTQKNKNQMALPSFQVFIFAFGSDIANTKYFCKASEKEVQGYFRGDECTEILLQK